MLPELIELDRIRLDEDKSYKVLAHEIGLGDESTLHRLLRDPDHTPRDRTLHKIRKYLDGRPRAHKQARRKVS